MLEIKRVVVENVNVNISIYGKQERKGLGLEGIFGIVSPILKAVANDMFSDEKEPEKEPEKVNEWANKSEDNPDDDEDILTNGSPSTAELYFLRRIHNESNQEGVFTVTGASAKVMAQRLIEMRLIEKVAQKLVPDDKSIKVKLTELGKSYL